MGIDIQASTRPEGSNEVPEGFESTHTPQPTASSSKAPEPIPQQTESEDVEMEDDDEVKQRKDAEAEKKAGAEAYKKRDFDEAIKRFQSAWDIWPKDITFLTNLGGTDISYSSSY